MEMIDRYIYAVTQHLPENIREDVSKELRSNIQDMLPEDASDAQIKEVLEKLGNPAKLAVEYNPQKSYLIGPGVYSQYIKLLKLVTGIAAITLGCIAIFTGVFNFSAVQKPEEIVSDVISAAMGGAMQGAFWVTLVFIIMERSGVHEGHSPFKNKKWTLEDLKAIPDYGKKKISRVSTTVEIFFTILFASLLIFRPEIIGVSLKGSGFVPILNAEILPAYTVGIVLLAIVSLGILVWKTIYPYWSIPLAAANAGFNIATAVLMLFMVRDTNIVNVKFLHLLEDLTNLTLSQVTLLWERGLMIFAAVFIIIVIIDSIAGVFKCKR